MSTFTDKIDALVDGLYYDAQAAHDLADTLLTYADDYASEADYGRHAAELVAGCAAEPEKYSARLMVEMRAMHRTLAQLANLAFVTDALKAHAERIEEIVLNELKNIIKNAEENHETN